jgi:hypothetical protein
MGFYVKCIRATARGRSCPYILHRTSDADYLPVGLVKARGKFYNFFDFFIELNKINKILI